MRADITIFDRDLVADFDYRVTDGGAPMRLPSLAGPGDPGWPMEFEVALNELRLPEAPGAKVEVPSWLKSRIEEHLAGRADVYDAIQDELRSG